MIITKGAVVLKKIKMLPARDRVASELRNAIFSGKLEPGCELRQDQLAKRLGVSRMPVREALHILAGEGLIEMRANRGSVVKDISTKYIVEHFELRSILECEALAKTCRNKTDVSDLEYIHAEQKKAIDTMDMANVGLCNQAFHMFIWDHADNSKMKSVLEQLWNGLSIGSVVMPLVHAKQSYEEHELIIQAIKDNKPGVAKKIMRKHIKRSLENMLMRAPKNGIKPLED